MRHDKITSVEHENSLYRQAAELSRVLHVPFPEAFLKVSVIGEDGIRRDVINRHSRSLVRNTYNGVLNVFDSTYITTGAYADGERRQKLTTASLAHSFYPYSGMAARNVETTYGFGCSGIRIGTGTTAESFDDYVVETIIEDGKGGGQMEYATQNLTVDAWVGGGPYWHSEWERVFDNNSGGSINVTESVIYYRASPSTPTYLFCMSRDVFSPVAVADTESIAVSYEFRVTFP